MCAVVFIFCVPQVPHECLAEQVLSWKCKQTNACFCRCIEPLQEGMTKTCPNMKEGIIIKGEGFLLADLDKYIEVFKREPGEHFLSVICGALGGSWQCGTWLLHTLGHLVLVLLFPSESGCSFSRAQVSCRSCLPDLCRHCRQPQAAQLPLKGCSLGSKGLLRCSTEPLVTKPVSLHWPPQPHLCWLSWELKDPGHTENPPPNTLCLQSCYFNDKSKSSHFYNHRWTEAGLR